MLDSITLNNVSDFVKTSAVIILMLIVLTEVMRYKHKRKQSNQITKNETKTETANIVTFRKKQKTKNPVMTMTTIVTIIVCLLEIATIIFYSTINEKAIEKGAYDNIQLNQPISEVLHNIDKGYSQSQNVPINPTDQIVIFYRYGCPDCAGIHDDLMKYLDEHQIDNIYFVSSRSDEAQNIMYIDKEKKTSIITEVPSIVYYSEKGPYQEILYGYDENKNYILNTKAIEDIIEMQNAEKNKKG